MEFTREIARYAVESEPSDVPVATRHEATRALVNWIGLPIDACRHDTVERVLRALAPLSGPAHARVVGRGDRLDLMKAAIVNCVASGIADFDDTHLATVIHPTGPIASTLLALADRGGVTGPDFLHALVLGIEVQCRLAHAIAVPPAKVDEAWFLTGITGGVGAAVAAGRVLGLDAERMMWAIGIAAMRASGTRETHGSMAKNLVPAWAAEEGIEAALLAREGFTTSPAPLEGARGLGHLYARATHWPALTDGLGSVWRLHENAYKPFPSGIVTHGATTAALEVAVHDRPDPAQIERVDLVVHPLCMKLTGRRTPRTAVEGTFSVFHWVAVALIERRIGIAQFSDACVLDPDVIALRDRCDATVDERYRRDEAHIRIRMTDGRVIEHHVDHALGSMERPMNDAELTAKLRDLVDRVIGDRAGAALADACWGIEALADSRVIVDRACGVI